MILQGSQRQKKRTFHDTDFSKPDQVLDFTEGFWRSRDERRQQFERQWYVNISNFLGYQYHVFDDFSGKLVLPKTPAWRVRLVCNRLMGLVRKTVSKAMRQRPIWTSIPATTDDEDREASQVSTKLLHNNWREKKMNRQLIDLFYWVGTTGNVFMSNVWDPSAGPKMTLGDEDFQELEPQYQEKSYKQLAQGGLGLGDSVVEVCSPFEIDPDPNATTLSEAAYLLHSKVRSLGWLSEHFGEKAAGVTPDGTDHDNLTRFYQKRLARMPGPMSGGLGVQDEGDQDTVTVHCLWVKPTKKMPLGCYAVVAGGKVLALKKELPNPMREIPYGQLVEIPVPGRFWGTCSLEQCIPLQAAYNRGRSQLLENANLMGRPKWLDPNGSGVPEVSLNNKPGEVIHYNYPLEPKQVDPPNVPDYLHKNLEYNLKDIEDISAVHEVTNARAPSGVRAGVAIAQLQEQDDQMLAPTFLLAEDLLSMIAGWELQYYAHYVDEERIIRVVGENLDVESLSFTGKNLIGPNKGKPGVNYFDVRTEMGSQLPLSKASRSSYIIELTQAGILDIMQDRKKIHQMLELGTDEGVLQDEQLDRQNAKRENVMMLQGMDLPVNPWDNDQVHIDEHRRSQKQPKHQKLAMMDQMLVQREEAHIAQHEMRLQAMMAPPPDAAPGAALPAPTEDMMAPPPEAELPMNDEEALAMAQSQGEQIPPELLMQEAQL
jgi:hypothetical protein